MKNVTSDFLKGASLRSNWQGQWWSFFISMVLLCVLGTTAVNADESWALASTRTRLIGFNWADARDNFQSGELVLSGTLSTYGYNDFSTAAQYVASTFKKGFSPVNTVRIPINYATVNDANYWASYKGAIDGLLASGLNVIICYWPDGRDGFGVPYGTVNQANWDSAWSTVLSAYINNPSVYFEPINEPWGYSTWIQSDLSALHDTGDLDSLKQLYKNWESTALQAYQGTATGTSATSLPSSIKHRVILAGGMVEEDIKDLANDSYWDDYLLGFHMYSFVYDEQHGGTISSEPLIPHRRHTDWPTYLAWLINRHWPRVVITEFGAETSNTGYDNPNNGYDNSSEKVPSIQGIANYAYTFGAGMIWWPGFKGSYTQNQSTAQSLSLDGYNFFSSSTETSAGQYAATPYMLLSSTPANSGLSTLLSAAAGQSSMYTLLSGEFQNGCSGTQSNIASYQGTGGYVYDRESWASAGPTATGVNLYICNTENSDGFYYIGNNSVPQNGQVVEVNGNSTSSNAGLDFYGVNDQENQKWLPIQAALDQSVFFANEQDYQLWDVRGDPGASSTLTAGQDLDQWPLDGQGNQKWSVILVK
ncbi:cellulase family glycosylhydrolase [Dyella acidisoli]|uniref:Carbohydrate-binding protein n=1 Tax=Dyella acidisoli TaxID=1867834 RepID=A0ABQ5XIJ8_9GAMM|nr:cellulase family glycosylhydrolase [Dyella acidisoli]GLQ91514.1 carbohydrate-binding protein [Dyella acidisoli]